MDKYKFKVLFLECFEELMESVYRPPGMDKMKDEALYYGIVKTLEDEDFRKGFLVDDEDGE